MNILIVDDETALSALLKEVITRNGDHDVRTAASIKETKTILEEFNPDIIFSDQNLHDPDGEGTDLIRHIRESGRRAFICLMSGRGEPREHAADMFLHKPFMPRTILDILLQVTHH
jgi:DNA-binding response OmpR family regulator